MSSNLKCSILFGAGAENCFDLPSGGLFTTESLIVKNNCILNVLLEKYSHHTKSVLIDGKSTIFKEMILATMKYLYDNINNYPKFKTEIEEFEQFIFNDVNNKNDKEKRNKINELFNGRVDEYYPIFKGKAKRVKPICDKSDDKLKSVVELLLKNIQYYGVAERYFYCLIDPDKYNVPYSKIFNYYWSAYFSILLPLLKNIDKYKNFDRFKMNKKQYKKVLDDLNYILKYLYDQNNFESFRLNYEDEKEENYYDKFSRKMAMNEIDIQSILTTNYTPFLRWYFPKKVKISYLAGELNLFENARNNKVGKINKFKNEECFPFIMTQAPIKPIVHPLQIKEYNKAVIALNNSNVLVVIGYSLPETDNHILAMIKYYLAKSTKKNPRYLIYCAFNCNDEIKEKNKIAKKLKFEDNDKLKDNILVISHDEKAKNLYNLIQTELENIESKATIKA